MANYKSLQVLDAINRVKKQIEPQVANSTIFANNSIAPDATQYAPLYNEQRDYIRPQNKDVLDYSRDAAVALGKGIVSVPQAGAGLVDLVDSGLSYTGSALSGGDTSQIQGGRFTKALEELGVGFKETQDALGGLYSEGTQKQLQGLAALPGMSTEKSLGDNLSSLGQTAGYVLDNPSLALNTIVESLPAIAAGGVVGRGAAALGARGAEGAIGEGTVMAGQAQANMDRNAEGYTTGSQALGALGIGVLGGAVGQLGSKFAASHGAHDIDQLATGVPNQVANKGFTSLAVGTATEAAEEAAQSSLENVISNVTSGKDAIQGLNQDLVLGTLAGAGMGAASNAKSSIASAALDAITNAAIKQSKLIKERIAKSAPERSDIDTADLSNPSSPNYNPTAAIVREAGKLTGDSTPEEISAIKENVDGVMESAESKLAELTEMKSVIDSEATWKANLAKAQTAIQNLGDTDPVKSEKFQAAIDQVILPKLEQIEQVKAAATVDQLEGAISQASELVKDARLMHDKYSTALGQAATTLNGAVDKQIFGAPTSFSLDQIQSAINDASISDVSKVALRALSDAVVAQNAVKDLDAVNQQVTGASLDPKYMSTPQYLEQFGAAIQRGSTKAQANLLGQINAFETSHVAKAKLADTAFQFANQLGRSVQIIKADGEWKVNTGKPLKGDEAEQNGALMIHPAKNGKKGSEGVVNYINTEASAITATRAAMEAMINVNTNTPKESVSQPSSEAVQEVPTQQDVGTPDPMQGALDSYNQEARDNYDFQPDRRSVDPRDNETRPSTAGVKPTETATRTEVQPNSGSTPASSQTSGTAKADEGVASTQAQSKRKEDKPELVTWDNVQPNQEVTLYRGESSSNTEGGEWWTTDKEVAASFGKVQTYVVNSNDIGKHAVKGHGGSHEFIFPTVGNRPPQLAKKAEAATPEAKAERVTSRSESEDAVTEVQVSTETATEATNEEATEEVVNTEVNEEAEPAMVDEAEKPVKNPERDAERAKPINKRNLIVDGFNQRDTVLNRNEDFATKFLGRDNLIPAVEKITGNVPNEKQHQALKDFAKFNKYFSTKLDGLIFERKGKTAKGNDYADFRYQDFNQFLLEDGSLPENVKTAVAVAMYTWVAENGSKTLNSEKDVAGLLLVNDVDNLPSSVFSALTAVGDHQSVVTGSLGQKALEALGLKVVSDVDSARKQKLEQALGTLAAVALTQNGYLEHSTMPMAQFEQLQQLAQDANDRSYLGNQTLKNDKVINFLVPKSNVKVDQVIKSAAETSGIVPNLFGVQRDMKLPSLEPITSTPNSYNRMGSQLPTYTKEMLELAQKNGYKMSSPAMSFMDNVSPEDLRELFGYVQPNVDGVSFDGVHKKFWESQLASNQAVERAISIIKEQRAHLGDDSKEFFFEHTSWTNTRSGYDSAFNLQSTKIHRAVAGMSAHVVEVDIEAPMRNGETTKFGEFLMAVAMTAEEIDIGLKTVDKVSAETYLARFQEYLAQDYVQDAIESMASIIEGQGDKADVDNVKALTKEFGMSAMSVRGIQALAQMHIAERDGKRTFTCDIGFESDGVTNGPIITNVALATAYADMLEAGGIFTDKNKTNVPTNKELGMSDIYEQLGAIMKAMWADYKKAIKGDELASSLGLDVIYKAFGERGGAKPIVTTANYGAGIASIKRANAREVVNAFYKGLEKSANDSTKAGDLIRAVNETIKYSNRRQKLNVPLAIAQGNPLEFLLTPDQESALFYAANEQHGKAIKDTLDSAMSNFNVVRDINTEHAVAGFAAYEIIRNAAIEEALKDTTDVLVDGTGNRQEGLTSEQMKKVLKAIERYTPSVVSGMGNMSSNKKKSSIPLMKQDAVWDASKMSEQQFNFVGSWQAKGTGKFSVRSAIKRDGVQDPGVSGLALIIQSIDAMIAHTTIGKMITQNYHDANVSAVGQGKAMARIQNEAFVDGLLNTHVNREFTRAAAQAFQAFIDMPELLNSNTEQAKAAYEMLSQPLNERVAFAYQQDIAKLRNMLTWVNINQYGTQGGHYVMTDAKRVEILKQIKQLKKDLKKDLAQAKAIESLFNPTAATPKTIEDILRTDGTMKGEDLVPKLQAELKQFQSKEGTVGKFSQFYDSMLDLITDRMPAGLEINYFSEADAPSNVVGLDEAIDNNNPAWFTTGKDGNPQINILKSNDPIETLVHVHELVHAITVDSIAQVRNDPTAHAKAKESLDKIDALYEHVKAKVNADPKASKLMKYAVKNVEEFIATGFSYPEFVNYLDNQIAPKAARGKSRIVTALRSFVENILGVLESFTGRKYSAKDATALEALILDTTEFLGRTKPPTVGTQTTIFGAPQQARDNVAGYTSKQVFDALDSNLDPAFKSHLSSLMTQVSDTIYAGLDQSLINNPDGTWSVEKAWEEYIKAGKVNTTETATTAGFRMTEQESFAVESLYAALVHGLKDKAMSQVYAEMDKAFKVSKAKLKPQDFYEGDWATADKDDKRDAQDMHDFVFKYSSGNPEPLARFTAMALGSQQFNNLLGFAAKEVTQEPVGLFEKVVNGANDLVDYVGGLLTNSNSSQLVNNKLGLLSKELARIDAKNRDFALGKVEAQLEKIVDFTDGMSQKLRDQVVELVEHDAIANSRFTSVRFASNVTRLSAKGDLWTTLDVIKDGITQYNPNERLGIVGEIINEAANNDVTKDGVEKTLRLVKLNNQMKENIRSATTKNILSTFEDNGAYLSMEDKSSLTTMMRADVQSLTDTYSVAEIAKLYSDPKFLQTEINALSSKIGDQVMIDRAKDLAWYMVSGDGSNGLAKNARLIVSGFNTGVLVKESDPRINLVDKLVSLYAVDYSDSKDKVRINAIAKRELKNKVNGIDTLVKFHKELSNEAHKTLFVDNPTSAIKGYVPEITNHNREIRVATSDADVKLYKDQFYKEIKTLGKDPKDISAGTPRLFLTEEANIQRVVSGSIELVSTNRKGTPVILGAQLGNTIKAVAASFKNNTSSYDPRQVKHPSMIPNYNTKNEVIGFSYEMSGKNRDILLERNNDFSDLLGAYAATNFNKVTVPEQNNRVVDAALEDYKANFASNPRAYVTVGPNSNDYGLREVWAMMPESTRKHIVNTWGKDGMQVRNDVLLPMFGYRKYSLNQSFDKMDEAKNMFEKLYTGVMTELFGSSAKIRGVQAERAWQESVSLMKDIIVIRNVKTMIANIMTNSMLLMAHGVSPTDIVKDTLLSVRAGMQYRRDMANLLAAQQKQRAGVGDFNKLEQDILRLQDSLSRNPLSGFIEEGMMPTIVEDVDPDTNHYSYKSKLQKRIDAYTDLVPKSVKTAAKWAFVSPDTPLYKLLNNATQFSDFSSKYVMYKYYTQKAKEKLSHDAALQIASDNFVNYDVPTARGLQYLNDMGIVMFTKYNIRIQKALFQLLKKRPATAMAQALFINSFTNMEAGIDPLIWFNMGNPLRSGGLGLPSALDEPIPIKMLTSVF